MPETEKELRKGQRTEENTAERHISNPGFPLKISFHFTTIFQFWGLFFIILFLGILNCLTMLELINNSQF